MEFIWKEEKPKIKNSTLYNDYENGELKNIDIFSEFVSLQCSWIKRLFDDNLICQYLGKNFKFSNLEVSHSILCKFLNSIKRYSLDGVNIFLHRLLSNEQLYVRFFGVTSVFKLVIKAFIYLISPKGI